MKKLSYLLPAFFISLLCLKNNLEAVWVNASDFSQEQLKVIAHHIVNSDNGKWRLEEHIIPRHAGDDALNAISQGNVPKSYFRLNNHGLGQYEQIINYTIDNGNVIIGQESSPKKFSILALIPNNELANFSTKENTSIGAWMKGEDYRRVSKVKAVFSVMNMTADMVGFSEENLIASMDNMNKNLERPAGDLITVFPIPNHWNK